MPKACQQLRLLPAPRPLVERLGADFFRGIPRAPGVYRMFDQAGQLIYVGKAKDLRMRLGSYRSTQRQARKTIRLIHTVNRIEWEICLSETAAQLLENQLIRSLRPRFNRAGTWPRSARFIGVRETMNGFELAVVARPSDESYGAFRGGASLAIAALARLAWFAFSNANSVRALPHPLVKGEGLRRFRAEHPRAPAMLPLVREFLSGTSDRLIAQFLSDIREPDTAFDALFVALQFEMLQEFFRRGPLRNRRLRDQFPGEDSLLAPEELDDLRILAGPPAEGKGIDFGPALEA